MPEDEDDWDEGDDWDEEDPPETWDDHPSLTAAQRNPSMLSRR